MLENIKLAIGLWRLARRLREDAGVPRAASLTVIVEGEVTLAERRRVAIANGEPIPDPRVAYEVTYWADMAVAAGTKAGGGGRGHTIEEALSGALQ